MEVLDRILAVLSTSSLSCNYVASKFGDSERRALKLLEEFGFVEIVEEKYTITKRGLKLLNLPS